MSVTAYLCANGASDALDFYTRAFGAVEKFRWPDETGRLGHAEFTIGSTTLYISDEHPELGVLSPSSLGGAGVAFVLEVDDVDAVFARAIQVGAELDRPLKDDDHGRNGWLRDPFGYRWNLLTPNPNFNPGNGEA